MQRMESYNDVKECIDRLKQQVMEISHEKDDGLQEPHVCGFSTLK